MFKLIMQLVILLSITTSLTAHAWLGSLARLGRHADDAASASATRYGQHLTDIPLDVPATQPAQPIGNHRFDVPWLLEIQRQQLQPAYRRLKPKRTADQIVVHLTVQPNGTVSDLKLISSTLKQPQFEAKLLSAIRQTQFGAGQYAVWSQSYRFEFKSSSSHKRR